MGHRSQSSSRLLIGSWKEGVFEMLSLGSTHKATVTSRRKRSGLKKRRAGEIEAGGLLKAVFLQLFKP